MEWKESGKHRTLSWFMFGFPGGDPNTGLGIERGHKISSTSSPVREKFWVKAPEFSLESLVTVWEVSESFSLPCRKCWTAIFPAGHCAGVKTPKTSGWSPRPGIKWASPPELRVTRPTRRVWVDWASQEDHGPQPREDKPRALSGCRLQQLTPSGGAVTSELGNAPLRLTGYGLSVSLQNSYVDILTCMVLGSGIGGGRWLREEPSSMTLVPLGEPQECLSSACVVFSQWVCGSLFQQR